MKEIIINTKEEYDKVQNELLAKGLAGFGLICAIEKTREIINRRR